MSALTAETFDPKISRLEKLALQYCTQAMSGVLYRELGI